MRDDEKQQQSNKGDGITSQRQSGDDAEAIPMAGQRAPGYFPAANEVCPTCHAQDYIPVRDAEGRNVRQCLSCGSIYLPSGHGVGQ